MAKSCTKAVDNMYCQARLKAAQYSESFKSREGAAPFVGVEKDTLAKYELGINRVPGEVVVLMADAYNAPELLTYYCANECPIGRGRVQELDVKSMESVTLQMLSVLRDIEKAKDTLLDVTEDGVITPEEKPILDEVIAYFDKVAHSVEEMKLWEKNS